MSIYEWLVNFDSGQLSFTDVKSPATCVLFRFGWLGEVTEQVKVEYIMLNGNYHLFKCVVVGFVLNSDMVFY